MARHREHVRIASLMRLYGITDERFNAMMAEQNGVCAICGKPPRGKRKQRLSVDHKHNVTPVKVRGLLCVVCNTMVGYLENPEWRNAARIYLARYGDDDVY